MNATGSMEGVSELTSTDMDLTSISYDLDPVTSRPWSIKDNDLSTWIYLVLLILSTLAGNIGNTMVIGAMFSDKRLWREANIFIFNLALADLCVTAFVGPFSVAGVFLGPQWFLDRGVLCHVIGSVCLVSCVCSLWSIAAISVNRYILLAKPQYYGRVFSWQNTVIIALLLWTGAFMLDLPNFLDWGDHTYDMKTMACSYDRLASHSYTVFFIMMFVTIPLGTVLYCNFGIYGVVMRSKKRVAAHIADQSKNSKEAVVHEQVDDGEEFSQGSTLEVETVETNISGNQGYGNHLTVPEVTKAKRGPSKQKRNTKNELRLAKTLFIVFIVFCLCWTPYACMCLFDPGDYISKDAYSYAILFAHTSSTLNSILYAVTNKSFRQGYKMFIDRVVTCDCSWPPK